MNKVLSQKQIVWAEIIVILGTALLPLFMKFPYRINIFLSWEGAYRLSEGQIPFKDFGMPLGYGYWILPAIFFKIFGPQLFTLLKTQAFINTISGLSFRSILAKFDMNPAIRLVAVFLFCLSYSLMNYWPWYNHTVFVFELIGIFFLVKAILEAKGTKKYLFILIGAFFMFLSFFTKQDGGALAFMLGLALIAYDSIITKKFSFLASYISFFLLFGAAFIIPLAQYDFFYWFNLGQAPHSSRLRALDFIETILESSMWIKFYGFLVVLILIHKLNTIKSFLLNKKQVLFALFTLGILIQASIIQVTSYIPPGVNIYFHSISIAFILSNLNLNIKFERPLILVASLVLVFFWWSGFYWPYMKNALFKAFPSLQYSVSYSEVSKNTWKVTQDTVKTDKRDWKMAQIKPFEHILMPPSTVNGIERLVQSDIVQNTKEGQLKVLNMSELTPLAYTLNYPYEKGPDIPLWYHKNVAIFDKEIEGYCTKINEGYYDLVLFETIPYLNNFYPDEIKECLKGNYKVQDKFLAPRQYQDAYIEVFVRP